MSAPDKDYDRIVRENTPLVRSLAARFRGRGAEYDDVFQAGCLGLYKAALRYDETLGTAFSTYAVPVIIGEIRMLFRDGGAVKVGRALRALNAAALAAKERVEKRTGREARLGELASELGESPERVASALTACAPTCSIDAEETAAVAAADETEASLTRLDLDRALGMLEPTERRLILLRYRRGLSQAGVGELLSMSQVQVSRREKKALQKLRAILT